jgi:hypothetical protein
MVVILPQTFSQLNFIYIHGAGIFNSVILSGSSLCFPLDKGVIVGGLAQLVKCILAVSDALHGLLEFTAKEFACVHSDI